MGCPVCKGYGFLLTTYDNKYVVISRCDACKKHESDNDAKNIWVFCLAKRYIDVERKINSKST